MLNASGGTDPAAGLTDLVGEGVLLALRTRNASIGERMGESSRWTIRDGDVRLSLSASDRPRRYAGRSTGIEERESSSREDSAKSEIVPSVGRGAIMAKGCVSTFFGRNLSTL